MEMQKVQNPSHIAFSRNHKKVFHHFPIKMKILVTFFCFLFFGLLVLLATVDLEPFLSPRNSQVGEQAVNINKKMGDKKIINKSPSLPLTKVSKETQSPDSGDTNGSEPALSRITTHQLVVADKRETENIATKTKNQEQTLPHPTDNISAPQFHHRGE